MLVAPVLGQQTTYATTMDSAFQSTTERSIVVHVRTHHSGLQVVLQSVLIVSQGLVYFTAATHSPLRDQWNIDYML